MKNFIRQRIYVPIRNQIVKYLRKIFSNSVMITSGSFSGGIKMRGNYAMQIPEKAEEEFLEKLDFSDKVVWDIGAYIGRYTVAFARRAQIVYAFEPVIYEKLEDTLKLNGCENVFTSRFCAGDKEGVVSIYIPKDNTGEATMDKVIRNSWVDRRFEIKKCPSVILDNLKLPAPDFVKMDVEGSEYGVLTGMKRIIEAPKGGFIEKRPELFIEIHGADKAQKRYNARRVYEFLASHYSIYHVETAAYVRNYEDMVEGHIYCKSTENHIALDKLLSKIVV